MEQSHRNTFEKLIESLYQIGDCSKAMERVCLISGNWSGFAILSIIARGFGAMLLHEAASAPG